MNVLILIYEIFIAKTPNLDRIRGCGLLAIKIGQMYALRSDFLSVEKTRELMKLYEKNFDQKSTQSEKTQIDIPKSIDPSSLKLVAEASIGKAYSAKYQEEEVIVKIIKADFEVPFQNQVRKMGRFLKSMIWIYPKLKKVADPVGTLEDVERMTKQELDLRNEISGQETLHTMYKKHQSFIDKNMEHKLYFHKIYPELSNKKILVSEKIQGESFNELLDQGKLPYQALLDFFFFHVFGMLQEGIFHEDIHPGNVWLTDNGHIALLDTASIGNVRLQIRTHLWGMLAGIVQGDYEKAGRGLISMSKGNGTESQSENIEALKRGSSTTFLPAFLKLYEDFSGKSLQEHSLTDQMMRSIKLAVHHGYEFERGLFPIIRSFMYLDGMALRCKPDTDLMHDIAPYVDIFEAYSQSSESHT